MQFRPLLQQRCNGAGWARWKEIAVPAYVGASSSGRRCGRRPYRHRRSTPLAVAGRKRDAATISKKHATPKCSDAPSVNPRGRAARAEDGREVRGCRTRHAERRCRPSARTLRFRPRSALPHRQSRAMSGRSDSPRPRARLVRSVTELEEARARGALNDEHRFGETTTRTRSPCSRWKSLSSYRSDSRRFHAPSLRLQARAGDGYSRFQFVKRLVLRQGLERERR
jgi:hypothetical protein